MATRAETRDLRARVLLTVAAVIYGVLIGRLFILQGLQGGSLRDLSRNTRIRREVLPAPRGEVLDRYGQVLAGNQPGFLLTFDPLHPAYLGRRSPDGGERLRETIEVLADVLEVSPDVLMAQVDPRPSGPVPLTLARNLSFAQRSRIWERVMPLPGVSIVSHPQRSYPHDSLACHVLGYLGEVQRDELGEGSVYHNGSLLGRAGLERIYESVLRSRDGETYVEVDALGRKRDLYEGLPQIIPARGRSLRTSLDFELQKTVETVFDSLVPRLREPYGRSPAGPPAGSVIVMDCRNGDILAMMSRPAFHPASFARGLSSEDWSRIQSGRFPLLNRGIQSRYPPGSVFKAVTALVSLAEGTAVPQTVLSPCYGSYRLGNRSFGCWKRGGHGLLNFIQGFAQSCDVYYYQLARNLGFERLTSGARALGIHVASGIDLSQEAKGFIPNADDYVRLYGYPPGPGVPLNLGIGQGELLFTPIELGVLYSALVNGGSVLVPRIGLEAVDPEGGRERLHGPDPEVRQRLPVRDSNLAVLKTSLEEVVMGERGTARGTRVDRFRIGGKTGTAQNPHGQDHALFVAAAPMDDPHYVVVVVVEEAGHGGAVAAPVARPILRHLLTGASNLALASGDRDEGAR